MPKKLAKDVVFSHTVPTSATLANYINLAIMINVGMVGNAHDGDTSASTDLTNAYNAVYARFTDTTNGPIKLTTYLNICLAMANSMLGARYDGDTAATTAQNTAMNNVLALMA